MDDNKVNNEIKKEANNENNTSLEEDKEISENEMKEIIGYINTIDYEKYEKDHEIQEALLLLKNKMMKEEMEKQNHLNYITGKETIITDKDINNDNNQKDEKFNKTIQNETIKNNNEDIFKEKLNNEQKELLEKSWNKSTKPELGEKIINEKGDKEIIIENKDNKNKVSYILILIYILQNKTINNYSYRGYGFNHPPALPTISKLLFNIFLFLIGPNKINIANHGRVKDKIIKEKSAEIPFLFGFPDI